MLCFDERIGKFNSELALALAKRSKMLKTSDCIFNQTLNKSITNYTVLLADPSNTALQMKKNVSAKRTGLFPKREGFFSKWIFASLSFTR